MALTCLLGLHKDALPRCGPDVTEGVSSSTLVCLAKDLLQVVAYGCFSLCNGCRGCCSADGAGGLTPSFWSGRTRDTDGVAAAL